MRALINAAVIGALSFSIYKIINRNINGSGFIGIDSNSNINRNAGFNGPVSSPFNWGGSFKLPEMPEFKLPPKRYKTVSRPDTTPRPSAPVGVTPYAPPVVNTAPPALSIGPAVSFIRQKEGFSSTVYLDSAGLPTIGYGHLLSAREADSYPAGISTADAERLLMTDIAPARGAVDSGVKVPLTQNQYTALISFVYNVGTGAFRGSTLLRKLNAGDYAGAALEFQRWNKATVGGQKVVIAGLTNRRASEAILFNA